MGKFGEKLNKEELSGLMDFAKGASENGQIDYGKFVDKLVNPHKYKNTVDDDWFRNGQDSPAFTYLAPPRHDLEAERVCLIEH